jgi:branched-chain amino acid transport system substrate-binding protein
LLGCEKPIVTPALDANGFQASFGKDKDRFLIRAVSYEVTDPTVDSQIIQLKDSSDDVFFNDAAPKAAAQAICKIADLRWHRHPHLVWLQACLPLLRW